MRRYSMHTTIPKINTNIWREKKPSFSLLKDTKFLDDIPLPEEMEKNAGQYIYYRREEIDFSYEYNLGNSLPFYSRKFSEYPGLKQIRDLIFSEFKEACLNKKSKRYRDVQKCLNIVLTNLNISEKWLAPIGISLNRNSYSMKKDKFYGRLYISYRTMLSVIYQLYNFGWICIKKGYKCQLHASSSYQTRIWPTVKLERKLIDIPVYIDYHGDYGNLVELKKEVVTRIGRKKIKKNVQTKYKHDIFTRTRERQLLKYNDFMSRFSVEYNPISNHHKVDQHTFINLDWFHKYKNLLRNPPVNQVDIHPVSHFYRNHTFYIVNSNLHTDIIHKQHHINLKDYYSKALIKVNHYNLLLRTFRHKQRINSELKTVFNQQDFNCGGRLYCIGNGYQNIRKEERKTITINGQKTVEIDYCGLHINMAYAEAGIENPYPNDPYSAIDCREGLKPVLKTFLLTLINSKDELEAIRSYHQAVYEIKYTDKILNEREMKFLEAVFEYDIDPKDIINKCREAHKPIEDAFCSSAGFHLMNMDSKIILDVVMHFIDKGIPCLPVHDSIIVQVQYEEEAKQVMQNIYSKHMNGFKCAVKKVSK